MAIGGGIDIGTLATWPDITSGLSGSLTGAACWGYGILALTTLPPLLPNAVLLVTGGMLAARGEMSLLLVLASVTGGAVLGDLLIHRFGHLAGGRLARRDSRLLARATGRVHRGGLAFVVGVRFLPGGRLLAGMAAGAARCPVRRFVLAAVLAESVWAGYSVGAGYVGAAVSDDPTVSVAIGIGLSVLVGVCAAAVRRRTGAARDAA
ncbi:DedA family protein [Streptomyces sp. VRA16 Mangrove soil]|uniref:DedA family protein n=1 Tax=Streptomyces sp. VRA16 Mangrove soil TaxID=2817434 RepID=UPI001A9DEB9F|nr:VTT domain-containing protein [Streptomyces sp. VRA16 Mangrove soil]MBO1336185.1 VTT domain-containing protein [Streptomyces sp. VRA16 Mangrove soil]